MLAPDPGQKFLGLGRRGGAGREPEEARRFFADLAAAFARRDLAGVAFGDHPASVAS